jgi:hypothetical protein
MLGFSPTMRKATPPMRAPKLSAGSPPSELGHPMSIRTVFVALAVGMTVVGAGLFSAAAGPAWRADIALPQAVMTAMGVSHLPDQNGAGGVQLASDADESLASGAPIHVQFEVPVGMRAQLSARELREQFRDWLLVAAVERETDDAAQARDALFDMPIARYGAMEAVSNFEYGPTRGRVVREGVVVALVPRVDVDGQARDHRAHIADAIRKDSAGGFERMIVYEYVLDEAADAADLYLAPEISYAELFSDAYGYSEALVQDRASLVRFLERTPDITYVAAAESGELTIGGRRMLGRTYRGIDISHVATVWNSEVDIEREQRDFENWAEQERRRLESQAYSAGSVADLQAQYDETVVREQIRRGVVTGSGFSLDPAYNFGAVATHMQALATINWGSPASIMAGGPAIVGACDELDAATASEVSAFLASMQPTFSDELTAGLLPAAQAAAAEDIVPLLRLQDATLQSGDPRVFLIDCVLRANQLQYARYDGPLEGTEVGMVLFYTDLIAKLWVINYVNSAPVSAVPNFVTGFNEPLERIYEREAEALPNARLWFGPSDRGFSTGAGAQSIYFARNATRIYSAGSNPLNPGRETQTSRRLSVPIDWWNNNYEEVAAYEPEYERLNEIMKWSLVIGWLNDQSRGSALGFLADETFARDNWFPEWARAHPSLRFNQWQRVPFYQRGYLGRDSEVFPQLTGFGPSPFGGQQIETLTGGVSLAPRSAFRARVSPTAQSVSAPARRSFVTTTDSVALSAADGRAFDLATDALSVRATPASGLHRTGRGGELANFPVQRRFEAGSGLNVRISYGDADLGALNTARRGNDFSIGFQQRAVDRAHEVARQATRTPDIGVGLRNDPNVVAHLRLGDSHFVKLSRTEEWVEIAPDASDALTVADGWLGRAAEGAAPRGVQFRLVTEEGVAGALQGRALNFGRGQVQVVESTANGRAVQLVSGSDVIPARVDASGVRVDFASLPQRWRDASPDQLARLLDDATVSRALEGAPRVAVAEGPVAREVAVTRAIGAGDPAALARAGAEARSAVQASARAEMNAGLARYNQFLGARNPDAAIQEVRALENVFGPTPALRLRRALAELDRGRPAEATASLREGALGRLDPRDTQLLDEISARMANTGSSNYNVLRDFAMYQRGSRPSGGAVLRPHMRGGNDMALRFEIGALPGQRANAATAAADVQAGTPIYVERNANFAQLDWSAPVDQVINRAIANNRAELVALPVGDAMSFSPSQLYVRSNSSVFEQPLALGRSRTSSTNAAGAATRPATGAQRGGGGEDCAEGAPNCPAGERRSGVIYVLRQVA